MLRTAFCFLLVTCAFGQANAPQVDPRETTILALERMWNEAQVNRDSAALDAMVGDHFIDTEWDGQISDKPKFLSDIRDPLFRPSSMTSQDVSVVFYGDTAIVTGTYHTKGTYQGKPYDHIGRFTDTWIAHGSKWQCVSSHSSLVKK
ncbi:MAG TPA: nuclear transport factor 2 family protein [Candidatus Sulfotelmatobacter sp.]|nr:nuclear transport factor 2 family protein [Candidatus Sulfotelmatobacter sp.]